MLKCDKHIVVDLVNPSINTAAFTQVYYLEGIENQRGLHWAEAATAGWPSWFPHHCKQRAWKHTWWHPCPATRPSGQSGACRWETSWSHDSPQMYHMIPHQRHVLHPVPGVGHQTFHPRLASNGALNTNGWAPSHPQDMRAARKIENSFANLKYFEIAKAQVIHASPKKW